MTDYIEEQEMEAEALSAIFDQDFEIISSTSPFQWSIKLLPIDCVGDSDESEKVNFVALKLLATIPETYPDILPQLDIELLKGLSEETHKPLILDLANEEAQNNEGMPAIFAICECIKNWLMDNNVKGQDDSSMYAQMMRKEREQKKEQNSNNVTKFESQKKEDEMTQAELEEMQVRKRRAEGTPCTKENFDIWWAKFIIERAKELEQIVKKEEANADKKERKKKSLEKEKQEEWEQRLTGFQQFSKGMTAAGSGGGNLDLQALEEAVDQMDADGADIADGLDEDLFNEESDEDLDDLDFDSDDDEYDDSEDDEDMPDI